MKSYTNLLNVFLLLCSFSILSSCGSGFYSPINEVMHSPSEKGELVATLNFNQSNAFKIQSSISYSPLQNIGLAFSNVNSYTLKSNTIALGLYSSNIVTSSNKKLFYDLYGGMTKGRNNNTIAEYISFGMRTYHIESDFNKFFVQAGLHTVGKNSSFDLIARYSALDFKKIVVVGDIFTSTEAEALKLKDPFKIFEISPKFSVGPPQFKINAGFNWTLIGSSFPEFDRIVVFSGVSVNLRELFKKNAS